MSIELDWHFVPVVLNDFSRTSSCHLFETDLREILSGHAFIDDAVRRIVEYISDNVLFAKKCIILIKLRWDSLKVLLARVQMCAFRQHVESVPNVKQVPSR